MNNELVHHRRTDIDWLLARSDDYLIQRVADDHGNVMTADQVRSELQALKAAGHVFVNLQKCDNWDPKHGCLGHPAP